MRKYLGSLKLKLLTILVVGACVALFLSFIYALYEAEQQFAQKMQQKKAELVNYADILAAPLWNFNTLHVSNILDTLMLDPDLIQVEISDESGNTVVSRQASNIDHIDHSNLLNLSLPLTYTNAHIEQRAGTLKVVLGNRSLRDERSHYLNTSLFSLLLVTLMMLGGVWLAFSRMLDRPIQELLRAIRNSHGHGGFVKVAAPATDELGMIADAFNDMQDRLQRHQDRLVQSKEQLQTLYHATPALLFSFDREGNIQNASDYFLQQLGYQAEGIIGRNLTSLLADGSQSARVHGALTRLWQQLQLAELPLTIIDNQGRQLEVLMDATLSASASFPGALAVMTDVTSLNNARRELEHQASTDYLSGIANRYHFQRYLSQLLQQRSTSRAPFAVLFIDLDHFKAVNDTYGHHIGDQLLCQATERIQALLIDTDMLARLGGDEFAVIMEQLNGPAHAQQLAQQIVDCLQQPFRLENSNVHISASVGIALYPDNSDTPTELLKQADVAMYRAKEQGRSRCSIFSAEHHRNVQQRVRIEELLHRAIKEERLQLYYQPIIDARQRRITGLEALLRLQDDDGTLIAPTDFIPVAEETGLILELGDWCLREACQQLAYWCEAFGRDLYISVNVSTRQFQSQSFYQSLTEAISQNNLAPEQLMLEITESLLLQDSANNQQLFHQLSTLGCKVAIDDFGTGYSALSYLLRFPISTLKIDRSFTQQSCTGQQEFKLMDAIVQMGKSLQLEVIVEGVEHDEQLQTLLTLDTDISLQGFRFARPMPATHITQTFMALDSQAQQLCLAPQCPWQI